MIYHSYEIQVRKLEKVILSTLSMVFTLYTSYKNIALLAEAKQSYFCAYSRLRILILVNILRL